MTTIGFKIVLINGTVHIVQEFTLALQILGNKHHILVCQVVNRGQDGKIHQHAFNKEEEDDKGAKCGEQGYQNFDKTNIRPSDESSFHKYRLPMNNKSSNVKLQNDEK